MCYRLDGLNKTMRDWDIAHYGRIFNAACKNAEMPTIQHPDGKSLSISLHEIACQHVAIRTVYRADCTL